MIAIDIKDLIGRSPAPPGPAMGRRMQNYEPPQGAGEGVLGYPLVSTAKYRFKNLYRPKAPGRGFRGPVQKVVAACRRPGEVLRGRRVALRYPALHDQEVVASPPPGAPRDGTKSVFAAATLQREPARPGRATTPSTRKAPPGAPGPPSPAGGTRPGGLTVGLPSHRI
jgi:hypothetical protein